MSKEETQPEAQGAFAFKVKDNAIVQVWCPYGVSHGQSDADGDAIYSNTHHTTYDGAKAELVSRSQYVLMAHAQQAEEARERLQEAEAKLLESAQVAMKVFKQHGWPQEER